MVNIEYVNVKGEKVPALGLGTWQIEGKRCEKAVKNALNIGYRHIDTAQAYGNEQQVGNAINTSDVYREDIWLTTKIWRSNFHREDVKNSFEESLNKLQTDYVDLLLIHWPHREIPFKETLSAMTDLVEAGKVKNIGVSNFTVSQLREASNVSETSLLTNQVEYHPFLSQKEVLEECKSRGMMLTAYSPLARGNVLDSLPLKKLGNKYGKSSAQIALRWLVQQENVSAIPKASTLQHQKENFDIFDFELKSTEMAEINELSRGERKVDPGFAPDWD